MGQNESKPLRYEARTLLQALNDRDQEVIDQCLKHESVKQLIDDKVKLKEITNLKVSFEVFVNNKTCLGFANTYNDARTVLHLLQAGADVTATDSLGYTPLHDASGSTTEAKQKVLHLLRCNASLVRARDNCSNTPLQCAAFSGNDAVISVLIQHGADVNELGQFGRTALHGACNNGHVACIHVLVRHGSDVDLGSH